MPRLLSAKLSDVGRKRHNNEDYATLFEPKDPKELQDSGCLYIIADGVGGASKGERASQYAADKVLYEYYQLTNLEPAERLRQAITHVNQDIFSYAEQSERLTRMATTMVAAVVRGNALLVANVGDSRAYLIRNGEATQISRDHSIVGEMMATGEMTEAEAQASNIKNRLTRSIGGEADAHVQVYDPITLQPGDKILLCTDGLTRYALLPKISELTAQGTPNEIVERLIQYANKRGGADNVSAIMVAFEPMGIAEQPTIVIPVRPHPPLDWALMETMQTEPQVALAGVTRGIRKQKKRQNGAALLLRTLTITVLIFSVVGLVIVTALSLIGINPFGVPTKSALALPLNTPILTPDPTGTATALSVATPIPTILISTALAKVKSEPVSLHKLPSNDSDALKQYSPGDSMIVLGQYSSGEWLLVEAPGGITGWVYSGLLSFTSMPPAFPIITTITPGTVPTLTATPTVATATKISTPKPPAQLGICVVQVKKSLSDTLNVFGLKYVPSEIYYNCNLDSAKTSCVSKIPIQNNDIISPENWLELSVSSQAACVGPGGMWVTDASH